MAANDPPAPPPSGGPRDARFSARSIGRAVVAVVVVLLIAGLLYAVVRWFSGMPPRTVVLFSGCALWVVVVLGVLGFLEGQIEGNPARAKRYHLRTVRVLVETLLGVPIAFLLLELPHVKEVVRHEFEEVLQFREHVDDADYLRRTYNPSQLAALRRRITSILQRRQPIPGEEALLDSLIYPQLRGPIREDLQVTRTVLHFVRDGETYHQITEDVSYTQYNPPGFQPQIQIEARLEEVPGMATDTLFRVLACAVDDVALSDIPQRIPHHALAGGRRIFSFERPVLKRGCTHVRYKTLKYLPRLDTSWMQFMVYPTHRIGVTLSDVDGLPADDLDAAVLLVNGLSDSVSISPKRHVTGMREWSYDSWLLANHSWVLHWRSHESVSAGETEQRVPTARQPGVLGKEKRR